MTDKSIFLQREPDWFARRKGLANRLPATVASWLVEPGSLTRRVKALCPEDFSVAVLRQGWARPFPGEHRVLGLRNHRAALVREVRLQGGGQPLVLARTVIPAATLRGSYRRLGRLGTRPLGEVIFANPRLERQRLEFVAVQAREWKQGYAPSAGEFQVWGRRTLYAIGGARLLVCEFFLPELLVLEEIQGAE